MINHQILIVDDEEFNRDLLEDMLVADYSVVQAENGKKAIEILEKDFSKFSCVLLDINMNEMNGYEVLAYMRDKNWLKSLPVIMISAEEDNECIKKTYNLGAIDYINRPFDIEIVKRRIAIIIALYTNQKKLEKMILKQLNENERTSNMLLSVLGHIVEFRNKESGTHIESVEILTQIFLEELVKRTEKYNISKEDIINIKRAAALHDAGKISVPEEILNKPGKLTSKEFEIIKRHTLDGAEMLNSCNQFREEPIVKKAYNICRWHHERYDGKGYPDGLKGDEIPIEAQVVALADVYDALTSIRCYKKAIKHEDAVKMILEGECGCFNPVLIEILNDIKSDLPVMILKKEESKESIKNKKVMTIGETL